MRIAVVSPFVDRQHGTERALAELLERLARDYDCEIYLYAQRAEDIALDDPQVSRGLPSGTIFWRKVPSVPGPYLFQFFSWLVLNRFYRFWDRGVRGIRFDAVFSPGINCLDASVVLVHVVFHRLAELLKQSPGNRLRSLHRKVYYRFLCLLERTIYADARVALQVVLQRRHVNP